MSEANPEQDAPKNVNDLIADAIADPVEHLPVMVGLGLAAILIAAAIYKVLQPKKQIKVTLDDVSTGDDSKKKEESKKGAAAPQQDKTKPKSINLAQEYQDAIDLDSFHKELDQEGPFPTKLAGTFEPQGFVKLRRCINKHGYKAFVPKKEALLEERLGYLKQKKVKEYASCIGKASQEYQKYMIAASRIAIDFLGVEHSAYFDSKKETEQDPKLAEQMKKDEENVRYAVDKRRELVQSRDEIKAIIMEQTTLEAQMEGRLAHMKARNAQEGQMMYMIERTRIMDHIYLKHGVRIVDLMFAVKEHDLENDADVKALRNASNMQREQIAKAKKQASKLDPAHSEYLKKFVESMRGPEDTPMVANAEGILSFQNYIKIFTVTQRLTLRFFNESSVAHKSQRRALLEAKKEKEYQIMCQTHLTQKTMLRNNVTIEAIRCFGVSAELFNTSSEYFRKNQQYGKQLVEASRAFETAERRSTAGNELEFLEALGYIERIEEAKANHAAQATIALHTKRITAAQMGPLQELAKTRALDKLFFDTGVEEEDIMRAFLTHRISEREEFKAIVNQTKAKVQEKVQVLINKLAGQAPSKKRVNPMAAAGATTSEVPAPVVGTDEVVASATGSNELAETVAATMTPKTEEVKPETMDF